MRSHPYRSTNRDARESETMGLRASIHAISRASYAAALRGDMSEFDADFSVESVDLDKAWHAIHYLLTGDSELNFLLTGTQIAGVSEHCEVHSPKSLRSLQLKLASMSVPEIMSGFRVDTFNDLNIYPGGWTKDMAAYIAQQLERFPRKLRELVDRELGLMVIIL
jgi:Domain of unknown function (DUF1877)